MDIKYSHTDISYMSLKDIKKKYPESYKAEKEYRENRSFKLPLEDLQGNKLYVTQTPWILQKEIKLISKVAEFDKELLFEIGGSYNMKLVMKELLSHSIVDQLWTFRKDFDINMTKGVLKHFVLGEYKPKTKEEKEIVKIISELERIHSTFREPKQIILDLYGISDIEEFYPKGTKKLVSKKYYQSVDALYEKDINSVLVKLSMFIYMMYHFRYFKDLNEFLIIALTVISYLSNSIYESIAKISKPITFMQKHSKAMEKAVKEAEKAEGDITFIYLLLIDYLTDLLEDSKAKVANLTHEDIEEELSVKEQNVSVDILMKKNPELSRREARFLVSHNSKGEKYTIQDFMKYTNSSYETGRYSLENLVKLGFYTKEKVGKKYMYKVK